MKKIYTYLSILINYYIDVHTFTSFIIIMLLFGIGYLNIYFENTLLSILFIIIALFIIIIRTIGINKINNYLYNKWFYHNNYFFMIKEKPYEFNGINEFNRLIIYKYNYKFDLIYYNLFRNNIPKYEYIKSSTYVLNISYSRLATKKEIRQYKLESIEAKMLLLEDTNDVR